MSTQESWEQGIHIENMYLRLLLRTDYPTPDTSESHRWGRVSLHTHPFFELYFCSSGSIEIKAHNESYTLFPGDIAIIPADVEHVKLPSAPHVRWGAVRFTYFKRQSHGTQDLFGIFHRTLSKRYPIILRQRHELTSRLFRMVEGASKGSRHFLALNLADILSRILDDRVDSEHRGQQDAPPTHGDVDIDSITRLEDLVAKKYMEEVSTESAARLFHISARQLDRMAHRRYGVTFRQAIINRRIEVAIEMFSATAMTIEEIGTAVGFSSRLSFSRAFRARHGMSPQQYRKAYCSGL
ncbi:MAG: helix-turn-helix transcriptional regulator [Clostridia bacterium]|nr:helix-turn-helix transcriptional regulator [Clostridia bacterium]